MPNIIKIRQCFRELQLKTSVMFFETQCILLTDGKSHTGFRLVPKLVTLSDFECRNGRYFAYYAKCVNFYSKRRQVD